MRTFQLYPEERHFWSFNDYGAVLDVMELRLPKRILEFGPGSSTLALIEGGAETIDACEDDPHYFATYQRRLAAAYPSIVSMQAYRWSDPLRVPQLDGRWYDLALIDGPRETPNRAAAIEYCLQRCAAVLIPLEEHPGHQYLRPVAVELAKRHGRSVEIIEDTGPLAGAFALLT